MRRRLRTLVAHTSTPVRLLARELRREACRAIVCQEYEHFRFATCIGLGRLPGDIHFVRNGREYSFPFASSLLLTALVTWLLYAFR